MKLIMKKVSSTPSKIICIVMSSIYFSLVSPGSGDLLLPSPNVSRLGNLIPHTKLPDKESSAGGRVELLEMIECVKRMSQIHAAVEAGTMLLEMGIVDVWNSNIVPPIRIAHIPKGHLSSHAGSIQSMTLE